MNSYLNNIILVAFLKKYNVRKIVLSSGARNIPFCNRVENDKFFECYSVVDERNAAFFALGLAQQTGEVVALACTSGTAVSNYLSGITEAFYSNVPLVAITFDRSPYALGQLETQKVDQPAILRSVTAKSAMLPLIKDDDDRWYFERLCNEAFIAMKKFSQPIHLNVPIVATTNFFYSTNIKDLPAEKVKFIDYVAMSDKEAWRIKSESLRDTQRILIVIGQNSNYGSETKKLIADFCKKFHCPVLADHLANFSCEESIPAEAVIKALNSKTFEKVLPELVISFGANFQERIKDLFKAHRGKFQHWSIEPSGAVKDVFKSQTAVFECTPNDFFSYFKNVQVNSGRSEDYLNTWKKLVNAMELPPMPFTNFYVVQEFLKVIPKNSILHLSILNSTRLAQFFPIDESVTVYSNVNAFGIDGCLPTFMGQSFATDKPAFLIIGDLSFFYAMNSVSIKHRKNNVRILLINNGGGAEFHITPLSANSPTIDLHIGAAHKRIAKDWVISSGYEYLSANDEESLAQALTKFVQPSDKPVLLEVFTDMKRDGEFCLEVYRALEKGIQPLL